MNSSSHSGRSCDEFPRTSSLSSFLFGFSVSVGPCDRFPCAGSLTLSLLVDAGCCVRVTASCDEDVGDVGEDELEEHVDRRGTTNDTWFAVLHSIFLAIFDEMWFLATGPMEIIPVLFAEFSE